MRQKNQKSLVLTRNREIILDKFYDVISKDSVRARNLIKRLDFRNDPYLLQCIAQTYLDESRFNEDGTQREYVEQRKWRMAERYIIKAFELNPDCLIVLSTMGSTRKSSDQNDIAIYCFERIIQLGVKAAKGYQYGLNPSLASELVNDAKFELYRLYYEKDKKQAEKYLNSYKKGLKKGVTTMFIPLDRFLLD
ncbi:hypothetical protein AAHN97_12100 [Chitinophaga niabensis]|uniref:hypothetical protein n=1 Tax=Chitinophaga niabensis TaxID=536979 RepID=UPI0031BA77E8